MYNSPIFPIEVLSIFAFSTRWVILSDQIFYPSIFFHIFDSFCAKIYFTEKSNTNHSDINIKVVCHLYKYTHVKVKVFGMIRRGIHNVKIDTPMERKKRKVYSTEKKTEKH